MVWGEKVSEEQFEYQVLERRKRQGAETWGNWNRVSGRRLYASLPAAKIRATLARQEAGWYWDVEVKIQSRPVTGWEDLV